MLSWRHRKEIRTIAKKQTFDQSKYIQQYMKDNYLRVQILLNRETDADMIEHLKQKKSMSGYVKELIRKDMDASDK